MATTCRHCQRSIVRDGETGLWIDPEATGDDAIWRESCDTHDTFQAEHEPDDAERGASAPGERSEQRDCAACGARAGEPCRWDCIGFAAHLDGMDELLTAHRVGPGAEVIDAHCLACLAATPAAGAVIIARNLTVEASKVYAAIHYGAESRGT